MRICLQPTIFQSAFTNGKFSSELGWCEFAYSPLYFNPRLPTENLQAKFNRLPWHTDMTQLVAWQQGRAGIPIVDTGMRELWETDYVHNRVRMIVGPFLVKNLLIDWRVGECWFWDCLVDADLDSNSASWQWVAGCNTDTAPYFRIFNPVLQGQNLTPKATIQGGGYQKLKALSNRYLFHPWDATESVLKAADVVLGEAYPKPIVDIRYSREQTLQTFKAFS